MAFQEAARLDQIEVGSAFLAVLSQPVCLVRLDDDDVRAIHDTCPHQREPLHEGLVQGDDSLACAFHGAQFDLTTGESIGIRAVASIPVYACKIEDGVVWVDLEQQLNDATAS